MIQKRRIPGKSRPSNQEAFAKAFQLHRDGRVGEAEGLYRSVLAREPAHPDALHLMGAAAYHDGRHGQALASISRAIRMMPLVADYHANLAIVRRNLENHAEALGSCRAALCIDPSSETALLNLGFAAEAEERPDEALAAFKKLWLIDPARVEAALHRADIQYGSDRLAEAAESYQAALCLRPNDLKAYVNRGNALRGLGRAEAAAVSYGRGRLLGPAVAEAQYSHGNAHYDRGDMDGAAIYIRAALSLKPDYIDAYVALGNALSALRHYPQAMECYRIAARVKPDYAKAIAGQGAVLRALGRSAEALTRYDTALALSPHSAVTHSNRGAALFDLGRPKEALASYKAALCLAPDHMEAHNNRGNVLADFGRTAEAFAAYDRAIRIKPDLTEAIYNRGNMLYDLGLLAEARASYETALAQKPDMPEVLAKLSHCLRQTCDWRRIKEFEAELARPIADLHGAVSPFVLLAADVPIERQFEVAKDYSAKQTGAIGPYSAWPAKDGGKVRLGYLSYDYRNHPVAQLCVELIECHDRQRFEVIGYSYGPDDGSAMRERLKQGFDRFVELQSLSHGEAARRIHEDGIDILIDLTGHTRGARPHIPAHRPAPVQVNFLGYPGTMGMESIDYIIADPICIPPGSEAHYTEKVVRLPDCYQPNDRRKPTAPAQSRAACGLPETGVVFCCFNNSFKITPEIFALWMRLLARVPDSVLWLLEANAEVKENLRREAAAAGILPDRLVFAPRLPLAEHLARHRLADLFLDTLPYNAHTTASDALWAGLPMVTCRGGTFPSRVAASLLTAIGLPELITETLGEYEELALALAGDPARLKEIKDRLAANRDIAPLFDTARFTRNIEAAYEKMWALHRGGQAPRSFEVGTVPEPNQTGFHAAVRAHQSGRFAEAEKGYRAVLAADPAHPGANHLLGVVCYQFKHPLRALQLIGRALLVRPADPAAHSNLGLSLRDLGRLDEAVICFEQAIRQKADYIEAYYNRGLALQDLGRLGDSLADFTRALCLHPAYAEALASRGTALRRLKRLSESGSACSSALRLKPDLAEAHSSRAADLMEIRRYGDSARAASLAVCLKPGLAEAYSNRGFALAGLGDHAGALAVGRRVVLLAPHVPEGHNNQGMALFTLRRSAEALAAFEDSLRLRPEFALAQANRGAALKELGRPEEALAAGCAAVSLDPGLAVAYHNCGVLWQEREDLARAVTAYDAAIRLEPGRALTHNNLGLALRDLGRPEAGLRSLDAALRLLPDYAEAQSNRGVVLLELDRWSEALGSLQTACVLDPGDGDIFANRAVALKDLSRMDEAVSSSERALLLSPDLVATLTLLVTCLQEMCAWDKLASRQQDMLRAASKSPGKLPPFMLLAMESSLSRQLDFAARYALQQSVGVKPLPPRAETVRDRIRLGYLSYDFRTHAVAQLCVELIERHDREHFEVIGYSYGPDDGGALRERLRMGFDRFVDIRPLDHAGAARRIQEDGIDILIDLTGFTRGSRPKIPAYRPAPVQVNFLGYPGTMGAGFIDYIVADRTIIPPEHEVWYSEKVARLPDCYQPNDRQRPIADRTPGRKECGLPEMGLVFCCFNNTHKITPDIFAVWIRLLAQMPGSVLWLLEANGLVQGNLRREAEAAGIAPDRLVFAPRVALPEHLARHRLADLFLDTLPYNAHTTGSDALWAGLPLITCRGEVFPSRVAASLLGAIGLDELVTDSLDAYEALALDLARDPARLAALKARLATNRNTAPLFDTDRFARNIEAAYRRMWERHQAGLPPQSFDIK